MKFYIVANIRLIDPERFAIYSRCVDQLLPLYGAQFIVRGGNSEVIDGDWQPDRLVVIEFPSRDAFQRFHDDPDYQAVVPIRQAASHASLVLVEGWPA